MPTGDQARGLGEGRVGVCIAAGRAEELGEMDALRQHWLLVARPLPKRAQLRLRRRSARA